MGSPTSRCSIPGAGEFGIACEACHGPGEEHVAANRDPRRRYRLHFGDESDDTITDLRRLSAERSSQVCGVCHGVTYPRPEEVANHFGDGRSFRPGDDMASRPSASASPRSRAATSSTLDRR